VKRNFDLASWVESPKIVVEVLSASNSDQEIQSKRNAVFAKGAQEFWVWNQFGRIRFYGKQDNLVKSKMYPHFPDSVAKSVR